MPVKHEAHLPKHIREKIWAKSGRGRTQTIKDASPKGGERTVYRIIKRAKRTIVSKSGGGYPCVVVFPRSEDKHYFSRASKSVNRDGPADSNPDAIGTVRLHLTEYHENSFKMTYAQGHFKIGKKDIYAVDVLNYLPEDIARKHAGWRKAAFKEMLRIVVRSGKKIVVHRSDLRSDDARRELESACKELGLKPSKGKSHGSSGVPIKKYSKGNRLIVTIDDY
ncbi:MAG: hypothetical protein ABID38_06635 [Candidatus Diapherotrites archaeon]